MSDATLPSKPPTYGEKCVGLSFNPSGDTTVYNIKKSYASIIDMLDLKRSGALMERNYQLVAFYDHAILEAISAQMWAVKAITWKS